MAPRAPSHPDAECIPTPTVRERVAVHDALTSGRERTILAALEPWSDRP